MIPELNDEERIFSDLIDDTVLFVYPSGPVTGEGMPQRFGFAFSLIGCSAYIFDEIIYSFENSSICPLPIEVVIP
jgi:hypothetical protein